MYDSHGNTTSLGVAGQKTTFTYDAGDRNTSILETLAPNTGSNTTAQTKTNKIDYVRDVQNRIVEHTTKTNDVLKEKVQYVFTGGSNSPDALLDAAGVLTQKYVSLPGGVMLTIKPADATPAGKTFSIPNMHGDVSATVDGAGILIAQHVTGPFGESVATSVKPTNTAADTTWNYVGKHQKLSETSIALQPVQMGARVYIPTLGRFLQVDPIEGGTENNYVYPQDPLNKFDLTGEGTCISCLFNPFKTKKY